MIKRYHGSENSFYLIDETLYPLTTDDQRVTYTQYLCKKGPQTADGVLFLTRGTQSPFAMRIFNADGTEAEMCGNGLRCFARYVLELTQKDQTIVETKKAHYRVYKHQEDMSQIGLDIHNATLVNEEGVLNRACKLHGQALPYHVTVSNPHLVYALDHVLSDPDLTTLGEGNMKNIKGGINTNLVVKLSDDALFVKTFERGVGLTAACGTGMMASALSIFTNDKSQQATYRVYNPGGCVTIHLKAIQGKVAVSFIGNATLTHTYEPSFNQVSISLRLVDDHLLENKAYALQKQVFKRELEALTHKE